MDQLVRVLASNTNSKILSSDPAGNRNVFRIDNSILNKIEIYFEKIQYLV